MLLGDHGEDMDIYSGDDLGFFKSIVGGVKKVGGAAGKVGKTGFKVVTAPTRLTYKYALKPVLKATAESTGAVTGGILKGALSKFAPQQSAGPACGFFQRISRLFGGNPSCE